MQQRRSFMAMAGSALAGTVLSAESPTPRGVPLKLEPLGFDFDALEPYLDAETMRVHHDDYHAQCLSELVQTLNRLDVSVGNVVSLMPWLNNTPGFFNRNRMSLASGDRSDGEHSTVVEVLRKHGGAHINHTAFWRSLTPPERSSSGPGGEVRDVIQRDFGSVHNLKAVFTEAAMKRSGSGWAWLCYRNDGTLFVSTTANEDNPFMTEQVPLHQQGKPILCLDLWEHSYHRRYSNDRRKYIQAWWNVVNWDFVERAYAIVSAQRGRTLP